MKNQYFIVKKDFTPKDKPVKGNKRFKYLSDESGRQESSDMKIMKIVAAYLLRLKYHPDGQKEVWIRNGELANWYGLDDGKNGNEAVHCIVTQQGKAGVGRSCVNQTGNREPAQLQGEDALKHLSEEEGRQADADHNQHGDHIVTQAVLMGSRSDAQRNGNHELENGSDQGNAEGNAHMLHDDIGHGNAVDEAGTQVALGQLLQPVPITGQNTHKTVISQAVHGVHCLNGFLTDGGTALIDGVDLALNEVNGHQTDQEVDDHGYADQNKNGICNSFCN
mgnify:CR=1 FL=1